jgi:hypothetical protein
LPAARAGEDGDVRHTGGGRRWPYRHAANVESIDEPGRSANSFHRPTLLVKLVSSNMVTAPPPANAPLAGAILVVQAPEPGVLTVTSVALCRLERRSRP